MFRDIGAQDEGKTLMGPHMQGKDKDVGLGEAL